MLARLFLLITAVGSLAVASTAPAQEKDKLDDQAKVVAEKFTRALLEEMKVDSVMKVMAVPHVYIPGEGKEERKPKVFKTLDEVKKQLAADLEGKKPFKGGKLTVGEVIFYEKVLEEKIPPEIRQALDEVMKKTDRIVKTTLSRESDMKEEGFHVEVITLVGWRDGQPKVVGFRFSFAKVRPFKDQP